MPTPFYLSTNTKNSLAPVQRYTSGSGESLKVKMNISPRPDFPGLRQSDKKAPILYPLCSLIKRIAGSTPLHLFIKVVKDDPSCVDPYTLFQL